MDTKAMYKLTYGLFVLTAKEGIKDNGCIINTAIQVTSTPQRISITVNKQNYTHDMIVRTGEFNVSVLDESVPFSMIETFGYSSGKDTDKIAKVPCERGANGIVYPKEHINAVMSCKVINSIDVGTHTIFVADVLDASVLSDAPSVTYEYYRSNIMPSKKPKQSAGGYRCKICGYIYEGDELPDDFICPICKHGASDFEKI